MGLSAAQRRQAHLSGLSTDIALENLYLPNAVANSPLNSRLPAMTAGFLAVTNTAYWVYVGQATRDLRADKIYFFVSVSAAGDTQVQELAIAFGDAPNRAAQSLAVKAVVADAGDYEAATGSFSNTTSFAFTIPGGTHIWLGARFAWAGTPTQPTLTSLGLDTGKGEILRTATPGVLAAGTSYTGALVTQSTTLTTAMSPDLTLALV